MKVNDLTVIHLPRIFRGNDELLRYEVAWDKSEYASYLLPENLSSGEVAEYVYALLPRISHSLWRGVLADLAEERITDWDILLIIFEQGDVACKVSVCLRPDIPDPLLRRCLGEKDVAVVEHAIFNPKVTLETLKNMSNTTSAGSLKEAIKRAIELKLAGSQPRYGR